MARVRSRQPSSDKERIKILTKSLSSCRCWSLGLKPTSEEDQASRRAVEQRLPPSHTPSCWEQSCGTSCIELPLECSFGAQCFSVTPSQQDMFLPQQNQNQNQNHENKKTVIKMFSAASGFQCFPKPPIHLSGAVSRFRENL